MSDVVLRVGAGGLGVQLVGAGVVRVVVVVDGEGVVVAVHVAAVCSARGAKSEVSWASSWGLDGFSRRVCTIWVFLVRLFWMRTCWVDMSSTIV